MNGQMKRRGIGLKGKIQILFILIFALATVFLSVGVYLVITPTLYDQNLTTLRNDARLIHTLVDTFVRATIRDHLVAVANQARKTAEFYYGMSLKGQIKEKEAYERFKDILLDPGYGTIGKTGYLCTVNTKGIAEIHPRSPGADVSGFEFIQRALRLRNGYLEYDWANVGEKVSRPKAGAVTYFEPWQLVVWASAYKSEFLDMVDQASLLGIIQVVSVGKGGSSFVLSGSGVILSTSGTSQNVIEVKDREGRFYFKDMLQTARQEPDTLHTALFPDQPGGNPRARIGVYEYYQPLDWIIVSSVPYNEITSIFQRILIVIVLLTVGFFIVSNVVVNAVFSRILMPVRTMEEVTKKVSVGDLTRRVPVGSRDEIGRMSEQFNLIIGDFEGMIGSIQETSSVLGVAVQDVSISSQEVASTSTQQAAAVKEIVSTMEDSDKLSKSIAGKIGEVAAVSANTKEVVQSGFTVLQASLDKMGDIQRANTDTIAGIEGLGEKIENIWEIVNIINGIADQTKIIAFNAELEASSAGDAGKTFRIVASEIRRLADSTVSSIEAIRSRIHEIQNSSDKLIIASEDGTAKIMAGLAQSNTLRQLFEDILRSSEISATSAEQIAAAIHQQVGAFEQTLLTLKQISEGINNFVVSTRSTSSAATSIQSQSRKLDALIGKFTVKGGAGNG